MKFYFLSIIILYSICGFAQKKNYEPTDTRRKNESFTKVPKGDIRTDLATFTFSGVDESVGKEPIQKIPFTSSGANFMNFESDDIKAAVTIAPFDATKHKLEYDEKYLIKIDRKTFYGDYGNVPKNYISKITVTIGKDSVAIPSAAYSDLYNLNLFYSDKGTQRSLNGLYKSKDGHRIYLYLFCKDNTGNYEVTWIIQDKKYLRRVLDYGFL